MANQLWCIDFLNPPTPLIISQRLPGIFYATQKLMLDSCKMVETQSQNIPYVSVAFYPSLKQNFIAYRSSKVSDCIFEIHQLWQSGFSRVYSNSSCSCWLEPEIRKLGQSSHKMCSNNILNLQESTKILNAHTKSLETYRMHIVYIYIYIYIYDHRKIGLLAQISQILSSHSPYHPSLPVCLPDCILCPYRAVVGRSCSSANTGTSMGRGP